MSASFRHPLGFRGPARRVVPAACLALALLGAACDRPGPAQSADHSPLRVSTAFGPFSNRLIEEYRRSMPDLDIQEVRVSFSSEGLTQIEQGTLDLGVVLADDAYRAYFGEDASQPRRESAVRAITLLQPLPTYLLARTGSNIRTVADLDGKTVAVGPEGSSVWKLGTLVLQAFGVEQAAVRAIGSREVAVNGLRDGTFDAIMLPGYVYPEAFTETLLREGGAYLLPIDGPPVE